MNKPELSYSLNLRGRLVTIDRPWVMGILNLTPDSFYKGSRVDTGEIADRAGKMLSEGADILDIGAQSTRPGAELIDAATEAVRLLEPLKVLARQFPSAILSVDTFYPEVAVAAIDAGASIINDVSGGSSEMSKVAARYHTPYILMHSEETNKSESPEMPGDLMAGLVKYFSTRINRLQNEGVIDIIVDPGFGFGKNKEDNLRILHGLSELRMFNLPVLVGLSRKRTIQHVLDVSQDEALNGTTVLNTLALDRGASILRVHDVKEASEAVRLYCAMKNAVKQKRQPGPSFYP